MLPHDAIDISADFSAPAPRTSKALSRWGRSHARRIFDIAVILAITPLLLPVFGFIALAIAITSGMPIIFCQARAGCFGRPFTILKFRTMRHTSTARRSAIAAHAATEITALGRLLRRAKLDELPQAWNVLRGDMSLVGPRPRVANQQLVPLDCRPGLTGPATLAFAHEDRLFAQIAPEALDDYYRDVVLPAKHRLDNDYMKRATLLGDLKILCYTVLGRWGSSVGSHLTFIPKHTACKAAPAVPEESADEQANLPFIDPKRFDSHHAMTFGLEYRREDGIERELGNLRTEECG